MKKLFSAITLLTIVVSLYASEDFANDVIPVDGGEVIITFIGHGTLMMEYDGKVIHIDPVGREADYSELPKADLVLITHGHGDHLDAKVINEIRKSSTSIIDTAATHGKAKGTNTLENGDSVTLSGILVEAVPAYNTTKGRSGFHPMGRDNGYVLTMGGKRFYIAGDTEDTPEMKALKDIDVAFLPVNQPYTMTPEQAVAAVLAFKPTIFYPYHYGKTDVSIIADALSANTDTEVRIRDM